VSEAIKLDAVLKREAPIPPRILSDRYVHSEAPLNGAGGRRKVLVLSYYFPPHSCMGTFRTLRFVNHLPSLGWDPFVVSAEPRLDEDAVDAALVHELSPSLMVEHLAWRRPEDAAKAALRSLVASNTGRPGNQSHASEAGLPPANGVQRFAGLRSKLSELLFQLPDDKAAWSRIAARRCMQLAQSHSFEAVYATAPPFCAHVAAMVVSGALRLPLILDFRDPWSRCPWGRRAKSTLAHWRHRVLERRCVRAAACVILNTERMAHEFRTHYKDQPAAKFQTIPNGVDPKFARRVDALTRTAPESKRRMLRILHPGSLYGMRDPRPFLAALQSAILSGLDVEFEQLGSCEPDWQLEEWVSSHALGNHVRLLPPVPHHDALVRMATADAFLLLQQGTDLQIPGKLFEMLPFRKPILAIADEGATADVIRRYGIGAVGASDNPANIAEAIKRVWAMCRMTNLADRFQDALAAFDAQGQARDLATHLERIATNGGRAR
jgi:glycosyltransferase involved in cell wall biosynthesis